MEEAGDRRQKEIASDQQKLKAEMEEVRKAVGVERHLVAQAKRRQEKEKSDWAHKNQLQEKEVKTLQRRVKILESEQRQVKGMNEHVHVRVCGCN